VLWVVCIRGVFLRVLMFVCVCVCVCGERAMWCFGSYA